VLANNAVTNDIFSKTAESQFYSSLHVTEWQILVYAHCVWGKGTDSTLDITSTNSNIIFARNSKKVMRNY